MDNRNDIILGIIRHIFTAIAGAAIVKYGVSGNDAYAIASGLTALAGVAGSVQDKRKRRK